MRPAPPAPELGPQRTAADYGAAYRQLAPRLERLVARNVLAPRSVIEDACQFAWSRLLGADPPIPASATLGWLTTTASREAVHALKARLRELPLPDEGGGEAPELPASGPGPERAFELRELIAEIHRLPARQRRMVWLQGLGYGYAEIARETGDSLRTVERQLLKARETLRSRAA